MDKREFKQGDVYIVDLSDSIGSEQGKIRPCVIVSCDSLNKNRPNIIVASITGSVNKKNMVNHYCISKDKYSWLTRKTNIVLLECIRDISTIRVERFIGRLDQVDIDNIVDLIVYDFKEYY